MPNTEPMETMDTATAQRVEQEKITRRAALRKLGFGAGLAAFSLLGVDDLARMVGQRLEQMAGDNKVANQVAKEFQQAGIAFAGSPSPSANCYGCCAAPTGNPTICQECCDKNTKPGNSPGTPRFNCYQACDSKYA